MKYLFVLLYFLYIFCINAQKPRVWLKVPRYYVAERVNFFLNENMITNCYEFRETQTNLLLKCWRENKLVDVSIDINDQQRQKIFFSQISVTI
tara:strand:- start:29 stop:307 length:279 start_codon:yes stop_codon:yes gene_type:complete